MLAKACIGILLLAVALTAAGCIVVETPDTPATVAAELTRAATEATPDVQAMVSAELTRAAPTATLQSTPDVQAIVSAELTRAAPTPAQQQPANPTHTPHLQPTPTLQHLHSGIAELVSRLRPSLAQILTSSGNGSGFVYDQNGLVATNAHVVDCCRNVTVILNNRRYEGTVLGRDDRADLAVVRINSRRDFTEVALGNAGQVSVGNEVVALGFPLNLGDDLTATSGIVSSRRQIDGYQYFQHDASINPGNSGGPLINLDGMVIGMNTSKLLDAEGVGFALSVGEMDGRLAALAESASAGTPRPRPTATPRPAPTYPPLPTNVPPRGDFQRVSAGGGHNCALKTDSSIICWGRNDHGQATPPVGNFQQVSAGGRHTCGLKIDGSVVCWGSNHAFSGDLRGQKITGDYLGQSTPPSGAFLSIDSGGSWTCGVKTDGYVICWGATSTFIDPSTGRSQASHDAPLQTTMGEFNQISVGGSTACGVRAGGSLDCRGEQYFCPNTDYGYCERTPPSGTFKKVESGWSHTCGIKQDDKVQCWSHISGVTAESPEGTFQQISIADGYTCGVKTDRSVICWVLKSDGHSILVGRDYGQAAPPAGTFQQVSAGGGHTCGVKTDGSVACWGRNDHRQATPP